MVRTIHAEKFTLYFHRYKDDFFFASLQTAQNLLSRLNILREVTHFPQNFEKNKQFTLFQHKACMGGGFMRSLSDILKVHKIEIFLASILKFVLFLCQLCQAIQILQKIFFDRAILGGGTTFPRSLKTMGNKNCFQPR